MSSSSSTSNSVLTKLLLRRLRYVMRPSSLSSNTKNIHMITVSAYQSWNSGVACRNSSPGWLSSSTRISGLKSSLTMYLEPGYASTLNIRLSAGIRSYSCSHTHFRSALVIGSLPHCYLIRSNSRELKNLGISNSLRVIVWKSVLVRPEGAELNASLMAASLSRRLSSSMGLPPAKYICGMSALDSMWTRSSFSVMVLPEIVLLSSLDDLLVFWLFAYGYWSSGSDGLMGGGDEAYPELTAGVSQLWLLLVDGLCGV